MMPTFIATFPYPRNWSKAKVLIILYSAAHGWKKQAFNAVELATLTGLTTASSYSLCTRLQRYDLVIQSGHSPDCRYRISDRGVVYVDDVIPTWVSDELVPLLQKNVKKHLKLIE